MSRFSDLAPSDGRYVDAEDKEALAGHVLTFVPGGVRHQPRARFGPRWLVDVAVVATGELVSVDFADNETRTAMFSTLRDSLDAGEEFDPVTLERVAPDGGGNAFWTFVDASAEAIAEPTAPEWPAAKAPAPGETPPTIAGEKLAKAGRK